MIYLEQIQKQLKIAIQYSGKTQRSIANELRVSQQMISSYLKGEKTPQIETLANLCKVLDLDANEILCLK